MTDTGDGCAGDGVPGAGGMEDGAEQLVAGLNQFLLVNRLKAIQLCLIFEDAIKKFMDATG